ncbi:hypothetical protein JCM8097_002521 [Rhodosporidiobolus ruineniae]
MDNLLLEAQEVVRNYRLDKPVPPAVPSLAKKLEETVATGVASSPNLARLPQEVLFLIADLIKPPAVLTADDEDLAAEAALAKERLLRHSPPLLALSRHLARLLPAPTDPPSREDLDCRARLLLVFGRFTQVALAGTFTDSQARVEATAFCAYLLHQPPSIRLPLIRHILSASLPPFFKPHPKLNPATGRVLSRPLGGDNAQQSWYEESEGNATGWRKQAGLGGLVKLLIEALQPGEVEDLWPLLLPPILSYLDDFETKHKVVGTTLLDSLLDRVDASLLRRTGVGKVFEKSLELCFSTLSDPLTPDLLSLAHPIALKLLNLQHPPPSASPFASTASDEPRFTALCALLSTSILPAWEFKSQHVAIETFCARALPPILDALEAGSIRYLQVLVPHLSDLVATTATAAGGTWTVETVSLMLEVARALESVVRNGKLRIKRWEGRIAGAVAQTWVAMRESQGAKTLGGTTEGEAVLEQLEEALKGVVVALGQACPAEAAVFFDRMKALDPVFGGLLGAGAGVECA